jgi:hypothetical protein
LPPSKWTEIRNDHATEARARQVILMAIKQGDSVTNTKCPEWGTGLVLSIGTNSVEVRFRDIGPKRLRMDVLAPSPERAPTFDKKEAKAGRRVRAAKP